MTFQKTGKTTTIGIVEKPIETPKPVIKPIDNKDKKDQADVGD